MTASTPRKPMPMAIQRPASTRSFRSTIASNAMKSGDDWLIALTLANGK